MDFLNKVRNCENVFGTMVSNSHTAEVMGVKQIGVDFVFIDNEHIALDRSQTSNMVNLYSTMGIMPIVRIANIDESLVSITSDMGNTSVLVPYVEEVDDVIRLGATFKYRPIKGEKLKKIITGEYKLNELERHYIANLNENRGFFINIESQKGIDNLPKMLETGYVDGVLIGPNDLSINLGIPAMYDEPLFESKVLEILSICKNYKVSCGAHFFWSLDAVIKYKQEGMNLLLFGGDINLFLDTLRVSKEKLFNA